MQLSVDVPPASDAKPRPGVGAAARGGPGRAQAQAGRTLVSAICWALALAVLVPLGDIVYESFRARTGLLTSTYSLESYGKLVTPQVLDSAVLSLQLGFGSALVATALGTVLAWLIVRSDVPWRRFFELASFVPFFLSPFLLAIAWQYVASPSIGVLNRAVISLGVSESPPINVYSVYGIVLVLAIAHVPLVLLMVSGALRQMDPALEQAARVCGANGVRTSALVTVPLVSRAVISAAIITFALGFEDLGVALVLGVPSLIRPLSVRIWETIQKAFPADYNFAAAAGVLMIVIPALAFWYQRRVLGQRTLYTVAGKATAPQQFALGGARWAAFAFCAAWVVVADVLPIGVLALSAFSRRWSGTIDLGLLTFDNFATLLQGDSYSLPVLPALTNSLVLAACTATVVILGAVTAAYGINRLRVRGSHWIDVLLSVPLAVPGVTIAVGLLNLLIQTPLYGTIWIIALAYAVRYFPYGLRPTDAALAAIHPELEEAARVSGGGLGFTLRRVIVPLLRPAMISGWLLLFVMFMREVSMSNLLYAGDNRTLSVALLSISGLQPNGVVAAFTLMQISLFLLVAALAVVVGRGRTAAFL